MKLSVSVTNYSWPEPRYERLGWLARFLDGTTVDTLWVSDHLLQADPSAASTSRCSRRTQRLATLGL